MTKGEACVKVRRLEALAQGNANEHEAQCAHDIAQKMILRYEIAPGEIPKQEYRPSKLTRSLVALQHHVVRLKMWCLVAQKDNEMAVDLAQVQGAVDALLEKSQEKTRHMRHARGKSAPSTLQAMRRRYL